MKNGDGSGSPYLDHGEDDDAESLAGFWTVPVARVGVVAMTLLIGILIGIVLGGLGFWIVMKLGSRP